MVITSAELTSWVGSYMWPLFRVAAMLAVIPVIGNRMLSIRIRLIAALAITMVIAPLLPSSPAVEPLSATGLLVTVQQVLIGTAMGFILSMIFAAFVHGGQIIAMQMGLGFASMVDPANGVQVPVISQFYIITVTLLFLAVNAHLMVVQVLVDSFRILPVAPIGMTQEGLQQVAAWAGHMFSSAVLIALPAVACLLIVNLAFGVIVRAAPQLNIFAVGFPVTMLLGFIVILLTLPSVVPQFNTLLNDGFGMTRRILAGGG